MLFIEMIIRALEEKYNNFSGSEKTQADILIWLYNQISDEKSKSNIEKWFTERERCIQCGEKLIATYKKDTSVNPPEKILVKLCIKCNRVV